MKFKALIKVKGNGNLIQKVFAAEDKSIKGKANYRLTKTASGVAFSVEAEDSVALRTVLNSITKILTVIEKISKIP